MDLQDDWDARKGSEETRVIWVAVIGVIALLIFMNVTLRPRKPAPAPTPAQRARQWHGLPNYMEQPEAASAYVDVLAARADGEFNRLTPDEQKWMDAMSAHHGAQMLRAKARVLRAQKAAKSKAGKPAHAPSP